MESPFKILLADDHVMFRRGVKSMIQGMDNVEVVEKPAMASNS